MKVFRLFWFLVPVLMLWFADGAGDGGDGGGDDNGGSDPPNTDPIEGFNSLIERHKNDIRAVAELLYRENCKQPTARSRRL